MGVTTSSATIQTQGTIYQPSSFFFADDFESGNFNLWNGTTATSGDSATVTSARAYVGTYSGRFQTSGNPSGTEYAFASLNLAVKEIYARGYFFIASGLPLADDTDRFCLIAFEVNGQLQASFRVYRESGVDKFSVVGFNGSSSVAATTIADFPVEGEWFSAEFRVKVDVAAGEYQAWINGAEVFDLANLNTASLGTTLSEVRFGLTSTINVQNPVDVYCDAVQVSTAYNGPLQSGAGFAVIGSSADNSAINNFRWLFGNESIDYTNIPASQVDTIANLDSFAGLVVWTRKDHSYNAAAIRQFAQTGIVIVNLWEFTNILYPSLASSTQSVSASTLTYLRDWGNFRNGDTVDIRNETGDNSQLSGVLTSGLSAFSNITTIARFDSTRTAYFRMAGSTPNSGFYVLDLDATTPESQWTGIWHVFPVVKMIQNFPTGTYARWMANGASWWDLTWVYNQIDSIVAANPDITRKAVIGYSVNNRPITAIFVGSGSKNAIIDGAIHGNEKSGTFAALRIAELLVEYYHSDPYWRTKLTEYKVIIIPVLNPDGFAAKTRDNAHGVDLNSQFPPDGTPTEPEALALINLMNSYNPTIYVNMHEGWYWYPLEMLWGNYESGTNKSLTISAMQQANQTFVSLDQYGWFTDDGSHVWVGKQDKIAAGGKLGMAISYASYQFHASCMLPETFMWSDTYGSKQSLWALDYYPAIILSFIQNLQR